MVCEYEYMNMFPPPTHLSSWLRHCMKLTLHFYIVSTNSTSSNPVETSTYHIPDKPAEHHIIVHINFRRDGHIIIEFSKERKFRYGRQTIKNKQKVKCHSPSPFHATDLRPYRRHTSCFFPFDFDRTVGMLPPCS